MTQNLVIKHAAELAAFDRHKNDLLAILKKVHKGNSASTPFDANAAWLPLRHAAVFHFDRIKEQASRQQPMLPAQRVERLKDLAKALNRAHKIGCKALKGEVRRDLWAGWWLETNPRPPARLCGFEPIKEALAAVSKLEAAAQRGARGIGTRRGARPGTGILSENDVVDLIRVFRIGTGQNPILGSGSFADFVSKFLIAVGRPQEANYVVEHFHYLRKRVRKESRQLGRVPFFDK
jgi:hypothetical protein